MSNPEPAAVCLLGQQLQTGWLGPAADWEVCSTELQTGEGNPGKQAADRELHCCAVYTPLPAEGFKSRFWDFENINRCMDKNIETELNRNPASNLELKKLARKNLENKCKEKNEINQAHLALAER